MKNHELNSLSPLDGRYVKKTAPLRTYFSEFAYIRTRVGVEIDYLISLSQDLQLIRPLSDEELNFLHELKDNFSLENAHEVKVFEEKTRHDVKAIEYFLRAHLEKTSLKDLLEWLHFGLTSADINTTAIALSLRDAQNLVLLPALDDVLKQLADLVANTKSTPMLARTHGQPAVPTTFGKEIAVFLARLLKGRNALVKYPFESKFSGAVGSFNAPYAAFPNVDWIEFNINFLKKLGLEANIATTQILPFDNWLVYFQNLQLINAILIDLAQDIWRYISDSYLSLRVVEGEVGSSTMPQKVNPIDFENAEGNFGIANALFEQYIRKLSVSRLQRDLSDSTVRRTFGTALGHTLIGYASLLRGLSRIEANQAKIKSDLEAHWEVIAEGAQTILRAANIPESYEKLKTLTRGKKITKESYAEWVESVDVSENIQSQLKQLSPLNYLGLSEQIAEKVLDNFAQNINL